MAVQPNTQNQPLSPQPLVSQPAANDTTGTPLSHGDDIRERMPSITTGKAILFAAVVLVVFIVGYLIGTSLVTPSSDETELSSISSYEDCVVAGYRVQRSSPRQCITPNGRVFEEEITTAVLPETDSRQPDLTEITCHPYCNIEDVAGALNIISKVDNYTAISVIGSECSKQTETRYINGDLAETIQEDTCIPTNKGKEIRLINGQYYLKEPGESWALSQSIEEPKYIPFPELLPQNSLSTLRESFITPLGDEIFYRDRFNEGLSEMPVISPESSYEYYLVRYSGSSVECYEDNFKLSAACKITVWFFDADLQLLEISFASETSIENRVILNLGLTSPIINPI